MCHMLGMDGAISWCRFNNVLTGRDSRTSHESNGFFKSIAAAAAVAVMTSGGIIGFAPTADAGQMMPKQGSCPSGTSSVGGGYCKVR